MVMPETVWGRLGGQLDSWKRVQLTEGGGRRDNKPCKQCCAAADVCAWNILQSSILYSRVVHYCSILYEYGKDKSGCFIKIAHFFKSTLEPTVETFLLEILNGNGDKLHRHA